MMKGLNAMRFLFVGLGGACGAIMRYILSQIKTGCAFPLMTFITNILGALLIGFIIGISEKNKVNPDLLLFLKVGVCGGFTTFSTFSAESLKLFEDGKTMVGLAYILLSITLCIIGVYIGKKLSSIVTG